MRYLIAFFIPPLAMFLLGKPIKAGLNLLLCLTLFGIPVAVIWALIEVASHKADKRADRLVKAMGKARR